MYPNKILDPISLTGSHTLRNTGLSVALPTCSALLAARSTIFSFHFPTPSQSYDNLLNSLGCQAELVLGVLHRFGAGHLLQVKKLSSVSFFVQHCSEKVQKYVFTISLVAYIAAGW